MPEKLKKKRHGTRVNDPSALGVGVSCSKNNIYGLLSHQTAKIRGFTLIEMLLTLAIIAILVSMAIPRYEQFVAHQDVSRVTQQIRDHLQLARNYAQTHQTTVQLCPVDTAKANDTNPTCSQETTWRAWVVAEVDNKGVVRQVIARSEPILSTIQITSGNRKMIKMNRQGGADGFDSTFTITSTQLLNINKQLTLASNGRIRE
ncbi:MAG: hypothetical protein H6R05_699 [Burkholderiaceae bacterium]|nr:hypothetical protein [Burkholderiaceae bacterium]